MDFKNEFLFNKEKHIITDDDDAFFKKTYLTFMQGVSAISAL